MLFRIYVFKIQTAETPAAAVISLCFRKSELPSQTAGKWETQRLPVKTLVYLICPGPHTTSVEKLETGSSSLGQRSLSYGATSYFNTLPNLLLIVHLLQQIKQDSFRPRFIPKPTTQQAGHEVGILRLKTTMTMHNAISKIVIFFTFFYVFLKCFLTIKKAKHKHSNHLV